MEITQIKTAVVLKLNYAIIVPHEIQVFLRYEKKQSFFERKIKPMLDILNLVVETVKALHYLMPYIMQWLASFN